jgi:hypothetical protein
LAQILEIGHGRGVILKRCEVDGDDPKSTWYGMLFDPISTGILEKVFTGIHGGIHGVENYGG